jgi:iron(III) transport system ATP-binding protein
MFLQLDRVTVAYGRNGHGKAAVEAASLSLSRGQIGVLIGPSGCGKTTLLRAVAGLARGRRHRAAGRRVAQ